MLGGNLLAQETKHTAHKLKQIWLIAFFFSNFYKYWDGVVNLFLPWQQCSQNLISWQDVIANIGQKMEEIFLQEIQERMLFLTIAWKQFHYENVRNDSVYSHLLIINELTHTFCSIFRST